MKNVSKREREKEFSLLEMVVSGAMREGDKLAYKGNDERVLVVGGGDISSMEVGVCWLGVNYS